MMWFRRERTYVIVVKGQDGRWYQLTAIVARTPRQAVDQVRMPGIFRAIDARAWGREYVVA